MRALGNSKVYTEVFVIDEPGEGGACHEYRVREPVGKPGELQRVFANISFQNGPIQEHGVNGCTQEDLLAVVIDRLRSFQAGDFSCRDNAIALTKCEEALMWLENRTKDRLARGVEGTNAE